MRVLIYFLMAVAIFFVIFNFMKINLDDPFGSDSIVAVITTIAAACSFLILAILRTSQQINRKKRGR
ncbi:MAG: hypothetical protein HKO67_03485 [Flavobacteriaceae bacterium]|nr:hypothetical protein [Flavobacteriaceae bacterium]